MRHYGGSNSEATIVPYVNIKCIDDEITLSSFKLRVQFKDFLFIEFVTKGVNCVDSIFLTFCKLQTKLEAEHGAAQPLLIFYIVISQYWGTRG